MSDKLRIRKWDHWQTYRSDRSPPPWIKVHRSIRDNAKWARLSDAQRGQLVCLWVLAADDDGRIPNDPTLLRKLCMLDEEPDLQAFVALGFIEPDGNVTSGRRQHDAAEESRGRVEAETEEKQSVSHTLDDLTLLKIRGLYGWHGVEGTDPILTKAFDDHTDRDRCLDIAVARLESEGGEYRAHFFRRILQSVIVEQNDGKSRVDAWLDGVA